MKAFQRIKREEKERQLDNLLFTDIPDNISLRNAIIKPIEYQTALKIILDYEYLGNMGITNLAFGIFFDEFCGGCVCYGQPARLGKYQAFVGSYYKNVLQLVRGACIHWTPTGTASKLIAGSLKLLPKDIKMVVAFADPMAGEIGTVYQATNWLYTGQSTDAKMRDRKHYLVKVNGKDYHLRTLVSTFGTGSMNTLKMLGYNVHKIDLQAKHRYIKLLGSHKENKEMFKSLEKYIKPYPKRQAAEVSREIRFDTIKEGAGRCCDVARI